MVAAYLGLEENVTFREALYRIQANRWEAGPESVLRESVEAYLASAKLKTSGGSSESRTFHGFEDLMLTWGCVGR